jgi:hypothetical protein
MFQTKVVETGETYIFCAMMFFFENRTVYEMPWKIIVAPDGPQMTIQRMRIACWVPKTTDTTS